MYGDLFLQSFRDYGNYLWTEITQPKLGNYFYALILVSIFFYALELLWPWRKGQARVRKDFWLDGFYMFFNFFLFSLVGFYAFSNVLSHAFTDLLAWNGVTNLVALEVNSWPVWAQLLTLFLVRDFIHWNVHRLLHRVPAFWEFHKVHHSVTEMGFSAHLRYHWMENVIYRIIEYIPLAMIGFGIQEFFLVHLFALSIGHFNHSNINVPLGPLKYIFNNPQMHIWHHAKEIPNRHGVNFGISLSLWDYIFRTNYIPENGRDIALGFDEVEQFPQDFLSQELYGFTRPSAPETITVSAEPALATVAAETGEATATEVNSPENPSLLQ